MIDIWVLYGGLETPRRRTATGGRSRRSIRRRISGWRWPRSAKERRPIVVWNLTRTCNLKCVHCYTDSEAQKYPG